MVREIIDAIGTTRNFAKYFVSAKDFYEAIRKTEPLLQKEGSGTESIDSVNFLFELDA